MKIEDGIEREKECEMIDAAVIVKPREANEQEALLEPENEQPQVIKISTVNKNKLKKKKCCANSILRTSIFF